MHKFTLLDDLAPERPMHGDASWAPDSSHCVIPPPLSLKHSSEFGILIDLKDPANIRVVRTTVTYGDKRAIEVAGEQYKTLLEYTCSDCSPALDDIELLRKHVDAKYLSLEDNRVNPNARAEQCASHDGTKIYYQKGRLSDRTTLYELHVASDAERPLLSHERDCADIHHMRPSPDEQRLAYQVTFGCGFVSAPEGFVLNLRTGVEQSIGPASGTMHWTSDSQRLYFHRDNYLHVAEFAKPSTTAPARPGAAATSPSSAPSHN